MAVRGLLAVIAVDGMLLAHALVHLFRQGACVDANAGKGSAFLGGVDHLGHLVAVWNVARVEAQAMDAGLVASSGKGVVVVDVGDHRQRRFL